MGWAVDTVLRNSTKGSTSLSLGNDVTTSTQQHGQRITTRTVGDDTEKSGNTKTTVTEDAGGTVSFKIPVRGGLGLPVPVPVCPPGP